MQTVDHAVVTNEKGAKKRRQPEIGNSRKTTSDRRDQKKMWLVVLMESDTT